MGKPFEHSEAWKSARALTNQVYALCRHEPLSKDFGLLNPCLQAGKLITGLTRSLRDRT